MVERSIHGQSGMVFLGYDMDGECLWGTVEERMKMGIPIDSDWNSLPAKIEDEMTDAGKTSMRLNGSRSPEPNLGPVISKTPREVRGGTFAPADIPVIKRALHMYLIDCMRSDEDHPDISHISNLFHRLNRI